MELNVIAIQRGLFKDLFTKQQCQNHFIQFNKFYSYAFITLYFIFM